MIVTVLGATGFIGTKLTTRLLALGHEVQTPRRDEVPNLTGELGHVIYAIGLTADFRRRTPETIEAHIGLVSRILDRVQFTSFLYLSSTRVYRGSASTDEARPLLVNPADPSDLYNLSKLSGEAICLNHPLPSVRVARLSNVYGLDLQSSNFLPSLIRDALQSRHVTLQSALSSAKDYISIDAAVEYLIAIASGGRHRLYNVASGINTSNATIAEILAQTTDTTIDVIAAAPDLSFSAIDIGRLSAEFPREVSSLTADLPGLISSYRQAMTL